MMFFDPNQPPTNQPGQPLDPQDQGQNQDQPQDQGGYQQPPQPGDNPPVDQAQDSIDAYTPPADTPQAAHTPWSDDWQAQPAGDQPGQQDQPDQPEQPIQPAQDEQPVQPEPFEPQPAQPEPQAEPTPAPAQESAGSPDSQAIEDQNIFHLLGLEDGNDEEKEAFLDELQQVIWEDFIESDASLLLTEAENQELTQIVNNQSLGDLDKQEQALTFLESKVPDLEEILLEKALELKQEMVMERIAGLREFHAGNSEMLEKISQAEAKIQSGLWRDGADLLNQLP